MSIIFKINGKQYEVTGKYGPEVSLNDYIRNVAGLPGTKAMCHEGGCGACVVAVKAADPLSNEVKTFAVNSCLVSALSCHGWEVTTVEGIGNRTIGYHEVQTRLAQFNGTQCGYCSPGWVMNMYSLRESKNKLTMKEIENSFASNICRCTGYRPIADAFKSFATDADQRLITKLCDLEDIANIKPCGVKCNKKCTHKEHYSDKNNVNSEIDWCIINESDNKMIEVDCGTHKWYKAYTLKDVFEVMAKEGEYKLVAGNTGQGIYHIKGYPTNVIDIFNVSEIKGVLLDVNLIIGAGMPLTEMMEVFQKFANEHEDFKYLQEFYNHMDLVAHIPVRNIGTIGGNLYLKYINREFQSDVFLLFETVGAMITIADNMNKHNTVTMLDFLEIDMKDKIIINVMLPPLSQNCAVKTYKIMPRSQNAHAMVNAGFLLQFNGSSNNLEKATLVYGSISPSFTHAKKTETLLVGKDPYTDETLKMALQSLSDEINPDEAPPEPSAAYRKLLAIVLYYKAILYLCPDGKLNPLYRSGGDVIKRSVSHGTQTFDTDKDIWPLNKPIPKIEALVQCSGEATFANDLPPQSNEVFAAFVTADVRAGSIIKELNAQEALKIPGVVAFFSAKDIPGGNSFTPKDKIPILSKDEEILCAKNVKFFGQPAGIIVARTDKLANKAAALVEIKYEYLNDKKPLLSIDNVLNSPEIKIRVSNDVSIKPSEIGEDVKHVVKGKLNMESQFHYYMEPQTCVVRPTEDGMEVYSSSQWLDLTNIAIAECLKVPVNSINVIIRRVGGGFGGKITRSSQIACSAALVSHLLGRPCRFILPLQNNMKTIGKRFPTNCEFEVGLNNEGEIQYLKHDFYQNKGHAYNEVVTAITAMHFHSCYETKRWGIEGNTVLCDLPSNTWCRSPASTEGIAMIEYIMEKIAYTLGKDPLEIRLVNMKKEDNPLPDMIDQIKRDSDYENRRVDVSKFNNQNRWRKRAIKLIPLTYSIHFFGNYNSLISIYHGDGSVVVTHGGIEMGQGINTKVAQVCAHILGVPLEKVSVKPSTSFTSPNSMVTGGSIGSECVSFATMRACEILMKRLEPIKNNELLTWEELIVKAYNSGVDLQASYMYNSLAGEIKQYDVYACCVLEVEVDILTGNHDVKRVDILEDTGRSLSPEIDVAQIEGAFVMGLGYWTSENLVYDADTGKLLTDRTWTYKPPGIKDIPADMRVYFRRNARNEFGVLQSKATGEPPFCLATIIIHALREAVREARLQAKYVDEWFDIDNPCTVENIFMAAGHKLEHFKLK